MKTQFMKNFYFIGLFLLSMYGYAQNFNQYKRTWATYNGLSTSEPSYLDNERNGILELISSISIGSTHDLNAYNLLRTDSTSTRITRPGVYYNYAHYNHAGQRVKYGYIDLNLFKKLPFNNNYFVVKQASDTPFLIGEFDENYQYNVIDSLYALNNHSDYYILDSGNINVPSYKIDENFNVYMTKEAYGEIPFEGNLNSFNNVFNSANTFNTSLVKINQHGELIWKIYLDKYEIHDYVLHEGNIYILARDPSENSSLTGLVNEASFQSNPSNVVLLRVNQEDGSLVQGTYFGNDNIQTITNKLRVYGDHVYLLLDINSGFTDNRFITSNAYQTSLPSDSKALYLAKCDLNFNILWGTYISGNSSVFNLGMDIIEFENEIYLSGTTNARQGLINTTYMEQSAPYGVLDTFVMKFDANGQLIYGSYFGGESFDNESRILPVASDKFYLYGSTRSKKGLATNNAAQKEFPIYVNEYTLEAMYVAFFSPVSSLNTNDILDSQIKVYPNPTFNKQITIEGNLAQNSKIEIFNLIGQKVYEQKVQPINRQFIHAPQLSNGTYILKYVSLDGNTDSQKIIIK